MIISDIKFLSTMQETIIERGAKQLRDEQRGTFFSELSRRLFDPLQRPVKNDHVRNIVKAALRLAVVS